MKQDIGASAKAETGSRASVKPASGLAPTGFDPARMLEIMAGVECALALAAEHAPHLSIGSFVESSTQFRDLAQFLHRHQHTALAIAAPEGGETTQIGSTEGKSAGPQGQRPNDTGRVL